MQFTATVGANSGDLSIQHRDNATTLFPFLLDVSRGGGTVRGVFDIDNSTIVRDSEEVDTSFFLSLFGNQDRVDFTAFPTLASFP